MVVKPFHYSLKILAWALKGAIRLSQRKISTPNNKISRMDMMRLKIILKLTEASAR